MVKNTTGPEGFDPSTSGSLCLNLEGRRSIQAELRAHSDCYIQQILCKKGNKIFTYKLFKTLCAIPMSKQNFIWWVCDHFSILCLRTDFLLLLLRLRVSKIILKDVDRFGVYLPFSNFDYFKGLCIF